jgi:sortase A
LPGESNGNTYLFAHSKNVNNGTTPQGGWFTRLDELAKGDIVEVFFRDTKYRYRVEKLFIVDPSETGVYTSDTLYENKNSLTMQTCYPRGDTSKRLIVTASSI